MTFKNQSMSFLKLVRHVQRLQAIKELPKGKYKSRDGLYVRTVINCNQRSVLFRHEHPITVNAGCVIKRDLGEDRSIMDIDDFIGSIKVGDYYVPDFAKTDEDDVAVHDYNF